MCARPSSESSPSISPSYDHYSPRPSGRDSLYPTSVLHIEHKTEQRVLVATERQTWAPTSSRQVSMKAQSQAIEAAKTPSYRETSSWRISLFPRHTMSPMTMALTMGRGMVITTVRPRLLCTPSHPYKGTLRLREGVGLLAIKCTSYNRVNDTFSSIVYTQSTSR